MTARDKVLIAAADLAVEEGSLSLTLDRVAARAGLSKGGLLYHFATKEALVKAMLDEKMAYWERCIDALVESGFSYPVAFVEAAFSREPDQGERENALGAVFIAAIASDRSLAEHIRGRFERMYARLIEGGLDPTRARVVEMATHGLFVSSVLGAVRLTERESAMLRHDLLSLLKPREDVLLAEVIRLALDSA